MRILVTGAGGFLGRAVSRALSERGHFVRAVVRSREHRFPQGVEVVEADLRTEPRLGRHLEGIDAVVHLAASVSASDFTQFSETLLATERLLEALPTVRGGRLILCSSFSVYDWEAAKGTVDESLAENPRIYRNGGYATAKLWQERISRRFAEAHGWELTIVRPGFIWGPGNELPEGSIGPRVGRLQLVFGPRRRLAYTHVRNCAGAIAACVDSDAASNAVLNVVDEFQPTAWQFARIAQQNEPNAREFFLLPVPYVVLRVIVWLAGQAGRRVLGPRAKLPSFLTPSRFAQGYKPLRYDVRRLARALESHEPLDFGEAVRATWSVD